jgi:RNA polymerase sigma-70 factor (ECF subfamily)
MTPDRNSWGGQGNPPTPVSAHTVDAARRVIEAIDRDARTRLLATLARTFGDLDLAEDVMQEAFAQALVTWPKTGIPATPIAWITTTAKRKAIDVVRRENTLARKIAQLRIEEDRAVPVLEQRDPYTQFEQRDIVPDDRLGLFFACAHPALTIDDRVCLTLRFVAGLTTAEIAHLLLAPVPTVQQRIVRAKKKIRTLGIPLTTPRRDELTDRLVGVQRVIYLMYTEGYTRSTGATLVRGDLTGEAIRLARVLHELMPGSAEVVGLLGLLLLTQARQPARTDEDGGPIPFAAQDRTLWQAALIREGTVLATIAASTPGARSYATQAAIAAVHAEAPHYDATDWSQIAVLYGLLEHVEPGPVVRLGRAVALGRDRGPQVGIRLLEALGEETALARFRPYHIACALTYAELGDVVRAAAAYERALELPGNAAEDGFLVTALAGLDHSRPGP